MLIVKDGLIIRGVTITESIVMLLEKNPKRVGLLLDEEQLRNQGIVHLESVFLDDRMHDWGWDGGKFRYYSHVGGIGETCDVLVAYESEYVKYDARIDPFPMQNIQEIKACDIIEVEDVNKNEFPCGPSA